jgi:hypothetical protein
MPAGQSGKVDVCVQSPNGLASVPRTFTYPELAGTQLVELIHSKGPDKHSQVSVIHRARFAVSSRERVSSN